MLGIALVLAGCFPSNRSDSEREWARSECNRILDDKDRARCLRRVEEEFGRRSRDAEPSPKK
jgi:hypothetical protein